MKNIEVTTSPSIKEQFVFGFTDGEKAWKLRENLEAIDIKGCRVLFIDMVFGHICMTLPNPAISLSVYQQTREKIVKTIKRLVEDSENGKVTLTVDKFEWFKESFKKTREYTLMVESGKTDEEIFSGLTQGKGYSGVYSAFQVWGSMLEEVTDAN